MAGLAVAACGGVPGNSVATVDGEPIARRDYDHWMTVVAKLSDPAGTPPKAGTPEHTQLRNQVVGLLVSFRWVDGQADAMDVKVSDAEVKQAFDEQRKQAFPKDADYRKWLKDTTQTERDILARVRLDLLSNKIRDKVIAGAEKVSDRAINDFYAKHKARFGQPEKRDLRVILTKGERSARRARAALERGDSWKAVAQRYSIDDTSKASGGKLPAQPKGTLDAELDTAVFNAEKGQLVGPIKTQFGHYVFTVTAIAAATQQTLTEAKPVIEQTLAAENRQKALDAFLSDFTARWREKTECADGFKTSDCANGPKPTPTPAVSARMR